jgi:hypothetical protein
MRERCSIACLRTCPAAVNNRREPVTAGEHDEPKRLPRKQALCQVVNQPDFRAVSDF